MNTALEGDEWSAAHAGRILIQERPSTHCTEGWVGTKACLEVRKISPHRNSIPGHPDRSQSLYPLNYTAHYYYLIRLCKSTSNFKSYVLFYISYLHTRIYVKEN